MTLMTMTVAVVTFVMTAIKSGKTLSCAIAATFRVCHMRGTLLIDEDEEKDHRDHDDHHGDADHNPSDDDHGRYKRTRSLFFLQLPNFSSSSFAITQIAQSQTSSLQGNVVLWCFSGNITLIGLFFQKCWKHLHVTGGHRIFLCFLKKRIFGKKGKIFFYENWGGRPFPNDLS